MEQNFTKEQLEVLIQQAVAIAIDDKRHVALQMSHGAQTVLTESVFQNHHLGSVLDQRVKELAGEPG